MDKEFDNLVQQYVDWWVERNPILGTVLGLHEYDHLLPDGSREGVLKDIEKLHEFTDKFEKIDEENLSPQKKVERQAVLDAQQKMLFGLETYRQWESLPNALDVLGAGIFRVYTRDFAPLEERLQSITSRLEKAPKYIDETKSRITKPVKLWVEIQLESSRMFPMFLDSIIETGSDFLDQESLEALKSAVQGTKDAILDYEKWMTEALLPIAQEEYRMGEEKFGQTIDLKKLGLSVEEIRGLGEDYLESYKKQLEELAEEIEPGVGVEKVREIVKSKHPEDFDGVIEGIRDAVEQSRKFIVDNKFVEVPDAEKLLVVETPSYLRNTIPFAAYATPGKYDDEQTGVYMVTPVGDNTELLKEHSYASIMNTSVHEGYPGHHLQLTMANLNESLVPLFANASETIEGWAHYCEDWMKERGFDDTPEARFIQTIDLLWRAARIIVDVDLHTEKITMEEGVDFLVDQVGLERPSAVAEVKRYTTAPAYQLCYLIGKHLIMQLRDEVKERMGLSYTDGFFHNTFLEAGGLSMYLTRQVFMNKLKEMGL